MTVERMDNVGIVVEDFDDTLARLKKLGAKVVDEVVKYEDVYRLR
jgi:adenylate cyclase class IV